MIKINTLKGFSDIKDKYFITTCGKVLTDSKNARDMHLAPNINKKGYHQVVLYKNDGTKTRPYIHKLVGIAFLKNNDVLEQVDHIDNNKNNNHINNLKWISNKENNMKKTINNTTYGCKKMTHEEVRELRKDFSLSGLNYKDYYEKKCKFDISEKSMRFIIQRKSYEWVTD